MVAFIVKHSKESQITASQKLVLTARFHCYWRSLHCLHTHGIHRKDDVTSKSLETPLDTTQFNSTNYIYYKLIQHLCEKCQMPL